jgi:hypothetical protein
MSGAVPQTSQNLTYPVALLIHESRTRMAKITRKPSKSPRVNDDELCTRAEFAARETSANTAAAKVAQIDKSSELKSCCFVFRTASETRTTTAERIAT